ncbi:TPA: flagellin lysine-N-methylase, partial [Bacillus thuringiensis]|nr:flagellin lysine-N-methylase [Bacillus thuringiensis]
MKKNFWITNYISEFSCIGSECEDTCCKNWLIYVDKEHYDLYSTIKNKKTNRLIQDSIELNPKSESDNSYGIIKLTSSSACPFLTEKSLCGIQMEHGPEALCKTCKIYPRVTNKVNEDYYQTGDLSCPEMARLILLSKKEFDWKLATDINDDYSIISSQYEINRNYVKRIHTILMDILSRRQYPLTKRLWLIGVFIEELSIQTQKNETKAIKLASKKIEELKNYIPTNFMKVKLPLLMQGILNIIANNQGDLTLNRRLKECLMLFQQGMQVHTEKEYSIQELVRHHRSMSQKYYQPFMSTHNYILENYCKHYFMDSLFPYNIYSMSRNYLIFILHFSILQFILVGISSQTRELNNS